MIITRHRRSNVTASLHLIMETTLYTLVGHAIMLLVGASGQYRAHQL